MDWSQQLLRTSAQQCLNLMFWSFFYACGLRTQLPELFEPRYNEDNIYLFDDSYVVEGTDIVHSAVGDTTGRTLPYNLGLKYNTILLFLYSSLWWRIFFRGYAWSQYIDI